MVLFGSWRTEEWLAPKGRGQGNLEVYLSGLGLMNGIKSTVNHLMPLEMLSLAF